MCRFALSPVWVFRLCSQSPSPLLPPWHSHTGKYDRHPLWLPRSLDRSDRRRQRHSGGDYAQSLLWQVQSHLLGWQNLHKCNNYDRQRVPQHWQIPPFNIKTDMCRKLSLLLLFQYKPELFYFFGKTCNNKTFPTQQIQRKLFECKYNCLLFTSFLTTVNKSLEMIRSIKIITITNLHNESPMSKT